jgi:phosphopantetheinyl transferase (holo-ACP synthase)
MQVLGYFARVSVEAVRERIEMDPAALDGLLSVQEREARKRCLTLKRRAEFVGGRIAGKLAFSVRAKKLVETCTSFCLLEIIQAEGRLPQIYYRGIRLGSVSISHSGRWAAACFSLLGRAAIDIEDSAWNNKRNEHCFCDCELTHIGSEKDARMCWTIKECCLKLANVPDFHVVHDAVTIRDGARKYVALPRHRGALQPALLAVFEWGTLIASIGVLRQERDACDIKSARTGA